MDEAQPVDAKLDQDAGWLKAWIFDQLQSGAGHQARLSGVRGEAMYVYGSIGIDAALTSFGEIWVGDYDFDTVNGTQTTTMWRRAEGLERIGFIVIAARRFAILGALLPERPAAAAPCSSCRATGDRHLFSEDRKESLRIRGMICWDCGGMGWRAVEPHVG